jgi:hypothetical protein
VRAAAEAVISERKHQRALQRRGRARLLALLLALWSADAVVLAGCPTAVVPEQPDHGGEGGGGGGGSGGGGHGGGM